MNTIRSSPKSHSPSVVRRGTRSAQPKKSASRHPSHEPILHGGADSSPYQRNAPRGGPIALTVDIEVVRDRLNDFYDAIKINAEGSRQEPGCVSMEVVRKQVTVDGKPQDSDRLLFQLYEVWADQAAIDEHRKTEHYRKWNEFRFGIKGESPAGIISTRVESQILLDI
jgi:quinol monooxygenase YgiN